MKFLITSGVEKQLLEAAASAAPEECCGLLLGRPGHIETAVPARNVARDRTRSFEMDPAVLLRTHREARGAGKQVIGHYHSHPNGVAEPSKRDAARALENGQLWLIIAAGSLTAWQAAAEGTLHNRFHPITLEPA
jgi:proteasome lid subunit RPN8/RPN11